MSVLNFNVLQKWWDNIVLKNFQSAILAAKTITANGTYDPADDDLDGYSSVTVNVPTAELGTKSITANGTYAASSDELDGYSSVTVNVEEDLSKCFTRDGLVGAVSIPTADEIAIAAFYGRTAMTSISANECLTLVGGDTFRLCTALELACFGKLTSATGADSFRDDKALATVDWGSCATIAARVFYGCSALTTLILRKTSVTTFGNINGIEGTPLASNGTGGTVYVPSNLIESYQTATNWSTLYAAETVEFVAIEGSDYENAYADGTAIE